MKRKCDNCEISESFDKETREANAQLIACAPEMMQSIQNFVSKIREYGFEEYFSFELHYAYITINKALGKENENASR